MGASSTINYYEKSTLEKVLQIHNKYREIHGSPPLKMSDRLCKKAEEYIKQLINDNNDNENDSLFIYYDQPLGVNIYIDKKQKSPKDICEEWYNENKNYNYESDKFQKNAIHFTQIVWKNSEKAGFSFNKKNKKCIGVALYYPAGNIFDEFKENVKKPNTK